ncbi:hypothetical protein F4811DRAFT_549593 [Daldinia bambusicola]|nr:hypothetical protein F4811DRAFT_549593 [Daldinia bambusicola]
MASAVIKNLLRPWHKLLGLQRQPRLSWHRARLHEELLERRDAKVALAKLSETADVFFAMSRAQHDGFPVRTLPRFAARHVLVYAYMLAKYTSRWAFYRVAAFLCGAPGRGVVREVANPAKDVQARREPVTSGLAPVSVVALVITRRHAYKRPCGTQLKFNGQPGQGVGY